MRSSMYAMAGSAATALAATRGFNYASQDNTESTFESLFTTAAGLVGADDYTSARLYTMIQDGTTNTVIGAIPAAIATNTTLLLGLWASEDQASFDNEKTALTDAISQYGSDLVDLVVGISVGSEDLYRISPTGIAADSGVGQEPSVLVDYISQVREIIADTVLSAVPVGHVDTWNTYVNSSNSAVIEACDFLGLDEYPYYQTTDVNDISNASYLFFAAYDAVEAVADGKDIWITESGWPVSGSTENLAVASTANAETYWQDVACVLQERAINTWWYILYDAGADPSFGVTSAVGDETPLYNLACNSTSSSSSSSSAASSTKSSSKTSASSVAAATTPSTAATTGTVSVGTPVPSSESAGAASATGASSASGTAAASGTGASGSAAASSGSGTLASSWAASQTPTSSGSTSTASVYAGAATKMDGSMAALALGAVAAVMAL